MEEREREGEREREREAARIITTWRTHALGISERNVEIAKWCAAHFLPVVKCEEKPS
jgi:hypothetical protein